MVWVLASRLCPSKALQTVECSASAIERESPNSTGGRPCRVSANSWRRMFVSRIPHILLSAVREPIAPGTRTLLIREVRLPQAVSQPTRESSQYASAIGDGSLARYCACTAKSSGRCKLRRFPRKLQALQPTSSSLLPNTRLRRMLARSARTAGNQSLHNLRRAPWLG